MCYAMKRTAHFLAGVVSHLLSFPARLTTSPPPTLMKFRAGQKCELARAQWRCGEGKGLKGENEAMETPFDQLRLINGVRSGVVDGDRPQGERTETGGGAERGKRVADERTDRTL